MSLPNLNIAVIGAGPVGLALALHAAQQLPLARISLFDARTLERDVAADPRTLALSLGSVQLLQRLGVWPAEAAQPILQVHVSQVNVALPLCLTPAGGGLGAARPWGHSEAPPTFDWAGSEPSVRLSAADEKVPMLGAVLSYGQVVAPMQRAWLDRVAEQPERLSARFGRPVTAVKAVDNGVELDAGVVEHFDLAVVAEGGVFAEQARKAVVHDYQQTAWVGSVVLAGATPGLAIERFTRHGPVALLPLRPTATAGGDSANVCRCALVWCVPSDDDPVAALDDAQRLTVLASLLPAIAGQPVAISALKRFALGLNAERSLVDGCTVRIGNAAQTLHPVAGQGMNLGLRDAFELVHSLRRDPQPASLRAVLRRVEWSRAPDRWAMIAATDFLARSFTWRWPGLPAARGLGLAVLQALPPLKSMLARQMMFGRR